MQLVKAVVHSFKGICLKEVFGGRVYFLVVNFSISNTLYQPLRGWLELPVIREDSIE